MLASVSPSDMAWIRTTVVPTVVTGELVQGHVGVFVTSSTQKVFLHVYGESSQCQICGADNVDFAPYSVFPEKLTAALSYIS